MSEQKLPVFKLNSKKVSVGGFIDPSTEKKEADMNDQEKLAKQKREQCAAQLKRMLEQRDQASRGAFAKHFLR